MMKSLCIVYVSKSGNTKKLAIYLNSQLSGPDLDVEEIEIKPKKMPGILMAAIASGKQRELPITNTDLDLGKYDFLLFGAPIWNKKPAPFVKTFVNQAKSINGKNAAFFLTHAAAVGKNMQANLVFKENLERQGVNVIESWLSVRMKKGNMKDGQQDIDAFVKTIRSHL